MTREFFNKQFAALANAYVSALKLSEETQDIYWQLLKDIPEKEFADGVKICLGRYRFFPTIHELGEAALPIKRILGPYNPYGESIIELDWQEQLKQLAEEKSLPDIRSPIRRLSDAKKV